MHYYCDACKRSNPPEISQIQVETGELIASKLGQNLRPRTRDLFVLCSDCGHYAIELIRGLVNAGGSEALAQRRAASDR
jgi:hypothetical protein